jgi:hypothetical protein
MAYDDSRATIEAQFTLQHGRDQHDVFQDIADSARAYTSLDADILAAVQQADTAKADVKDDAEAAAQQMLIDAFVLDSAVNYQIRLVRSQIEYPVFNVTAASDSAAQNDLDSVRTDYSPLAFRLYKKQTGGTWVKL